MDLLGDIAGIYELILGVLASYMNIYSRFSFTVKAIKKLYMVKTEEQDLF